MGSLVLNFLAAGMFGVAVVLLALAAYNLVRKHGGLRVSGSGGTLTSMRRAEMRSRALEESAAFRWTLPFVSAAAGTVNKLGMEPLRLYVHEPYVRAGYPGGLDDDELVATGTLLSLVFTLLIGFLCAALFGMSLAWLALMGLPLGFFAVVAHLQTRGDERQVEIMRALPYALDLLVLMLRSGTSLRIALARVIDDYQNHPLGVEFGQVLAEMDVGAPRTEAFKKMAERLRSTGHHGTGGCDRAERGVGVAAGGYAGAAGGSDQLGARAASAGDGGGGGGVCDAAVDVGADVGDSFAVCAVYCEVSGDGDVDGLRGISSGISRVPRENVSPRQQCLPCSIPRAGPLAPDWPDCCFLKFFPDQQSRYCSLP